MPQTPALPHALSPLLDPASIALIGASMRPGSVGTLVLDNLIGGGYAGEIHAINPKYRSIRDRPCHARIADIGKPVDLALVVVPAASVERVVDECAAAGVRTLVVFSAGYAETGAAGQERQRQLVQQVRAGGMRMLGPNCFGLMRPALGLDATFGVSRAIPGPLALISQSGGVAAALVDWAAGERVGLSAMVSLGGAADLDFGELIDYFAADAQTRAIMLYVEGIGDGRAFLAALRAATRVKPVVVLKAGRHAEGQRAVSSHTGALLGDDAVFDAALARGGAVRVAGISQLFAAANALAGSHRPAGDRLVVLSNGGGPGVLAADSIREQGLLLAELQASTSASLRACLPPAAGFGNPVDVLGDADATRYAAALRAVAADGGVDGVIALFVPQGLGDADQVAQAVVDVARGTATPIITGWMGGQSVGRAHELFESAGVPHCHSPESAVSAFATLASARRNRLASQRLSAEATGVPVPALALAIRDAAVAAGRQWLATDQALSLLAAFGLPCARYALANGPDDAATAARAMGFPVAIKIQSPDIVHKSEVGGVALDLKDEAAVRDACARMLERARRQLPDARIEGVLVQPMLRYAHQRELLLGLATDPVFGRTICFGAGGVAVEIVRDIAFGLPPLDAGHASDLIARTRVARLLEAYRNVPAVDRTAVIESLCALSRLACALPWVLELDINPLLSHPSGAAIVDARVRIDAGAPVDSGDQRHLAMPSDARSLPS